MSDISDHSDTNIIYMLSVNKFQQQNRKKNILKQTKHETQSQTHESCE